MSRVFGFRFFSASRAIRPDSCLVLDTDGHRGGTRPKQRFRDDELRSVGLVPRRFETTSGTWSLGLSEVSVNAGCPRIEVAFGATQAANPPLLTHGRVSVRIVRVPISPHPGVVRSSTRSRRGEPRLRQGGHPHARGVEYAGLAIPGNVVGARACRSSPSSRPGAANDGPRS